MKPKLTIFTPTYNRSYIIENVYLSLCRQTNKNFEWIVVDDGSTDNTKELINSFIKKDNEFEIKYYYKENGGSHSALNFVVPYAKTPLIMILDSDDYIVDDCVEKVLDWDSKLITNRDKYAGISGFRISPTGIISRKGKWKNKKNYVDATSLERYKYNLEGEGAEIYFIDVLKKFLPIPEFEGEKDVEKGVLWNRIAEAGYKIRWYNEPICVFEYLEDGLTRNINNHYVKNYNGYTLFAKEYLHYKTSLRNKLHILLRYCYVSNEKGIKSKKIKENLNINRFYVFLGIIGSTILRKVNYFK